MCCGKHWQQCNCKEPLAFDQVYEFAARPQDDVYECVECIQSCFHAGDLGCPSFRKYLTQCHHNEEPDAITQTCDSFLDWRDVHGTGYL